MAKGKPLHKVHSRIPKTSSNAGAVQSSLPPKDSSHVNAQMDVHEYEAEDLSDIHSKIRVQIKNWLSAQTNIQLREVKEHTDYKTEVERHSNGIGVNAAIFCMRCQKKKPIHVKNGSVKLSNWSKHIKDHVQNPKKSNGNQLALTNFLKQSCTKPSSKLAGDSKILDTTTAISVKSEVVSGSDVSSDPNELSPEQTPEPGITSEVALPDIINSEASTTPDAKTGVVALSNTAPGNFQVASKQNRNCDSQVF